MYFSAAFCFDSKTQVLNIDTYLKKPEHEENLEDGTQTKKTEAMKT